MELGDSRVLIAASTFIGSILGAMGLTKWKLKDHDQRIQSLEHGGRTVADCEQIRSMCPMIAAIQSQKESIEDLNATIKAEFSKHADLHLNLSEKIGRLQGKQNEPDNP